MRSEPSVVLIQPHHSMVEGQWLFPNELASHTVHIQMISTFLLSGSSRTKSTERYMPRTAEVLLESPFESVGKETDANPRQPPSKESS